MSVKTMVIYWAKTFLNQREDKTREDKTVYNGTTAARWLPLGRRHPCGVPSPAANFAVSFLGLLNRETAYGQAPAGAGVPILLSNRIDLRDRAKNLLKRLVA